MFLKWNYLFISKKLKIKLFQVILNIFFNVRRYDWIFGFLFLLYFFIGFNYEGILRFLSSSIYIKMPQLLQSATLYVNYFFLYFVFCIALIVFIITSFHFPFFIYSMKFIVAMCSNYKCWLFFKFYLDICLSEFSNDFSLLKGIYTLTTIIFYYSKLSFRIVSIFYHWRPYLKCGSC